MHRFLRLFTLWLVALTLPFQGAAAMAAQHANAAAELAAPATMHPSAAMPPAMTATMSHDAGAHCAQCPHHAPSKSGCGACCAPVATPQASLDVAPLEPTWASALPSPEHVPAPVFLTGGLDRPPRPAVA